MGVIYKYACKYCGATSDHADYGSTCHRASKAGFPDRCVMMLNDGTVWCEYCGRTRNDVQDLCRQSCDKSPTGSCVARR